MFKESVYRPKCADTYRRAHKSSATQTQTLAGIHRRASHKPPCDVRWQLCAPSRPFSAQPSGHVGSQNAPRCSKQQLETGGEGKLSCSFSCHTFPILEYELLNGGKSATFPFMTHNSDLSLLDSRGNYSLNQTVGSCWTGFVFFVFWTASGEQRQIFTSVESRFATSVIWWHQCSLLPLHYEISAGFVWSHLPW